MRSWVATREEDGVTVTETRVGVAELRFPPGYEQPRFGPEHGYLAVVLDGGLEKTFARTTIGLGAGASITIPAEAEHAAFFGDRGARVLVVRPARATGLLKDVRDARDAGIAALARRIAGELSATDAAAPTAVEGLALELVSAAVRAAPNGVPSARPPWLAAVIEQLHAEPDGAVSVAQLAAAANVHPAHLARMFRRHYGVSIATYLRRLRLDRAAAKLAGSDAPVARIAAEEGFADQSHFTRAFTCHTGVTPARYRRLTSR
jgi:AraC family transcriptional regulator